MENVIESIELGGFTGKIYQDEHATSPNFWGNTNAFLVYDHRQFSVDQKGFNPSDIFEHIQTGKKIYDGYWVFPVFAYIHSGVSLSLGRNSYPFTCNFDTSMKGFALVKRQKGWSYTAKQAEKIAQSIVEEWNTYLSGDVYGYIIEDSEGKELDSCWGFYGLEYCKEEVNSLLKYHLGEAFKKRCERLKTFIQNRVPLSVRQSELN